MNREEAIEKHELTEAMVWALREALYIMKATDWDAKTTAKPPTLSALEKRGLIKHTPAHTVRIEPKVREVKLRSGFVAKVADRKKAKLSKEPSRVKLTALGVKVTEAIGPGRHRKAKGVSPDRIEAMVWKLGRDRTLTPDRLLEIARRRREQAAAMYAEHKLELGCRLEDEADLIEAHAITKRTGR